MKIEVHNRCDDFDSYRAARVKSLFNAETGATFDLVAELPIDEVEWSLGLIVGPSGSGKTSMGRQILGEAAFYEPKNWPAGDPIIDAIDPHGDFNAVTAALSSVEAAGLHRSADPAWSAFAIAPMLTRRISSAEFDAPNWGTLIFHPSALPYGRGPDAVRWTVHRGERVSAATWFWATDGLDEGPICEQEVVVLHPNESPGRAYHTRYVPAGLRALERALERYRRHGVFRRVEQEPELATYDRRFEEASLTGRRGAA